VNGFGFSTEGLRERVDGTGNDADARDNSWAQSETWAGRHHTRPEGPELVRTMSVLCPFARLNPVLVGSKQSQSPRMPGTSTRSGRAKHPDRRDPDPA
jgi:hypothetical protein